MLAILAAMWAHNAFAHHQGKVMTPNLSLNPDASPAARRPLGAG
jgi:hypothetical protein